MPGYEYMQYIDWEEKIAQQLADQQYEEDHLGDDLAQMGLEDQQPEAYDDSKCHCGESHEESECQCAWCEPPEAAPISWFDQGQG